MHQVSVEEATARLAGLVREAEMGNEVIITENGLPVARLVAVALPARGRKPGSARGLIRMTEDFDAPLVDFGEYA